MTIPFVVHLMPPEESTLGTSRKNSSSAFDERAVEIYERAAEIITQKGFDATSMNDIAKAVDLTKAGLYYYIRSKKELLFAIMSFGMDAIDRRVIEPVRSIDDPEVRLREIIVRHAAMLTEYSSAITIVFEEARSLSPAHRKKIVERNREYFAFIRETLQELKDDGRLRDLDVGVAASNLFSIILGVVRWYRKGGRLKSEDVVDEILKLALNGLLTSPKPWNALT